jgi:hypothetical protein
LLFVLAFLSGGTALRAVDLSDVPDEKWGQLIGKQVTMQGEFHLQGKFGPFLSVGGGPVYLASKTFKWDDPYSDWEGQIARVTGDLQHSEADPAFPYFFLDPKNSKMELAFKESEEQKQFREITRDADRFAIRIAGYFYGTPELQRVLLDTDSKEDIRKWVQLFELKRSSRTCEISEYPRFKDKGSKGRIPGPGDIGGHFVMGGCACSGSEIFEFYRKGESLLEASFHHGSHLRSAILNGGYDTRLTKSSREKVGVLITRS